MALYLNKHKIAFTKILEGGLSINEAVRAYDITYQLSHKGTKYDENDYIDANISIMMDLLEQLAAPYTEGD